MSFDGEHLHLLLKLRNVVFSFQPLLPHGLDSTREGCSGEVPGEVIGQTFQQIAFQTAV